MSTTEITQTWSQLVTRWRTKDVPGYMTLLSNEVDVVNRAGRHFAGKSAFARQLARLAGQGLPEMFAAEHTLESIRLLQPGVAVLHELRMESQRQSRATYLPSRTGIGRWSRSASRQSTRQSLSTSNTAGDAPSSQPQQVEVERLRE